ncbi:MAG TPA: Hsp20/alpha crystallin family protein [Candidatus Limnocylindrales bacterium]|nr:Hsp20/alpha crystallin family protein [Candidatus Limnocylindrales bacterium]
MLPTRRRALFDLADLSWFPFLEPVLRLEEYHKDDRFVVRAEIPGIDPAKDVTVTAEHGLLRIAAVRLEETKDEGRTEFRYGTFHRSVPLPPGTKEETIHACYANGILEITMAIGEPAPAGRTIPIAVTNGQPKLVKKS